LFWNAKRKNKTQKFGRTQKGFSQRVKSKKAKIRIEENDETFSYQENDYLAVRSPEDKGYWLCQVLEDVSILSLLNG